MLSAVNTCGGTPSQSSKSSGARRFFPIVDDVDTDAVKGSCRGLKVAFGGVGNDSGAGL